MEQKFNNLYHPMSLRRLLMPKSNMFKKWLELLFGMAKHVTQP
jgi:hypothetical protein